MIVQTISWTKKQKKKKKKKKKKKNERKNIDIVQSKL